MSEIYFSVVIPTYNRPERLVNCLQALSQLDYPRDRFEVIVVDDGSSMALTPVIEPFQSDLEIELITQKNAGPASARNTGATRAKGQFIVFTDDDCQPIKTWLKSLETQFNLTPNALIGGRTLNALPENLFSTASQVLIDFLYEYYNPQPQKASFFASNNFALPTESFHQIGKFDTSFPLAAGEDREFCDRWLHRGYSMVSVTDAQVYHAHHLTLLKFWRQHFNYGRGAFHFHQLRAKRGVGKIKVEPLSFYFKLLGYPLQQPMQQSKLLVSTLFLLSQVANISGFFWERNQKSHTLAHQLSSENR
ncbi:MAG: glycosyltransferase [Oscillatoriales cyanobacterium RM2_1_1]|nr:glycosyltransferase [Oscillatoriales cyanobacterium SM2_3_0]NJO44553.1 glycosyltransferase [Oscillatoriales cyanobacterium RM2_1_1]